MGRFIAIALLFTSLSAQADLTMLQGHVRAMPPGQPNTAAFMQVKNTGKGSITLVSAQTTAAKKSEFHTHTMNEKGVMSMTQVTSITIEPDQTFVFKSGAHHVMLMGLIQPLKPGASIELLLQDSTGTHYTFDVPVVSVLDKAPMKHDHHHHGQE
jgi:copper(I)-binding protein